MDNQTVTAQSGRKPTTWLSNSQLVDCSVNYSGVVTFFKLDPHLDLKSDSIRTACALLYSSETKEASQMNITMFILYFRMFYTFSFVVVLFRCSSFLSQFNRSNVNEKVYIACRCECVCHSVLALWDCHGRYCPVHVGIDSAAPHHLEHVCPILVPLYPAVFKCHMYNFNHLKSSTAEKNLQAALCII